VISGKTRNVVNDNGLHSLFVLAAVVEQSLQLGSIRGLRRFTLFDKSCRDLVAIARTVLLTGLQLSGQAEILRLILRCFKASTSTTRSPCCSETYGIASGAAPNHV